ncbi:MAG: hypothetical protein WD341_02095 [Tistlia sp.]|uniref:hypothetical protein n=1 Tax=Tistlia sp. TaxID=3057121 RepID=UPI0034A31DC3
MPGQSTVDAAPDSAEDRNNLTYLADALGSAMAGRQADGLVADAAGGDPTRVRALLAEVVEEALSRHAPMPPALVSLPEVLDRLRQQAGALQEGQGEALRRLQVLEEAQTRQQAAVAQELAQLQQAVARIPEGSGTRIAQTLDSVDERMARLAEATRAARRKPTSPLALALGVVAALVAGALAAVLLLSLTPIPLIEGLRGAIGAG